MVTSKKATDGTSDMYRGEEICTKSLVLNPEGEYLKRPTREWKDNTEKSL